MGKMTNGEIKDIGNVLNITGYEETAIQDGGKATGWWRLGRHAKMLDLVWVQTEYDKFWGLAVPPRVCRGCFDKLVLTEKYVRPMCANVPRKWKKKYTHAGETPYGLARIKLEGWPLSYDRRPSYAYVSRGERG